MLHNMDNKDKCNFKLEETLNYTLVFKLPSRKYI